MEKQRIQVFKGRSAYWRTFLNLCVSGSKASRSGIAIHILLQVQQDLAMQENIQAAE